MMITTLEATPTSMSTVTIPSIGTTTRPITTVGVTARIGAYTGAGTGIGAIPITIAIGAGIPIGPTAGVITTTTGIIRITIGMVTMAEATILVEAFNPMDLATTA